MIASHFSRLSQTALLLIFLSAFLCFAPINTQADEDTLKHTILSDLAKQTQRHFHFVQEKKLALLKKPLVTEGELTMNNNTLTWDIQKPFAVRYVLTPDTIREIDAQGERIIPMGQNPLAAALTQAMMATLNGQWRDDNSLAAIASSGSEQAWQLHITPTTELTSLIRAMVINGEHGNISQIAIDESNGDQTLIQLKPIR